MLRSRGSVIYTISGFLRRLFGLFANVVLRRLIPPAQFGLWNLVQVIAEFVNKLDLGSAAAVSRDLPIERGRGEWDEVVALQSAAMVLVGIQGIVSGAGVLAYWYFSSSGVHRGDPWVWLAAAMISLFQPALGTGQAVLQSHGRFSHAGVLGVAVGLMTSACLLVGGVFGGAHGVILGGVVAGVLGPTGTWVYLKLLGIEWRIAEATREAIGRLLRFGVPLKVWDYPSILFFGIDALAVAAFYETDDLAFYATARLFSGVGYEIATRLTAVERNEWRVRLGRDPGDGSIPVGILRLIGIQSMLVLPTVAFGTLVGAAVLTRTLMPAYTLALPILQVLVLSWFVLPQAYGLRDLWVVRGNFRGLFISGLVGLGGFVLFFSISRQVFSFDSLISAAICFTGAALVYMIVLLATAGYSMWGGVRAWWAGGMILLGGAGTALIGHLTRLPGDWRLADGLETLVRSVGSGAVVLVPLVTFGAWLLVRRGFMDRGDSRPSDEDSWRHPFDSLE